MKQRYYPMLGFGSFESAARFCAEFDEFRQYLRVRRRWRRDPSLGEQRQVFIDRWRALVAGSSAA